MGLKILGLLCAGVFFGAALLEVKQMGWRRKTRKRDDAKGKGADGKDSDSKDSDSKDSDSKDSDSSAGERGDEG